MLFIHSTETPQNVLVYPVRQWIVHVCYECPIPNWTLSRRWPAIRLEGQCSSPETVTGVDVQHEVSFQATNWYLWWEAFPHPINSPLKFGVFFIPLWDGPSAFFFPSTVNILPSLGSGKASSASMLIYLSVQAFVWRLSPFNFILFVAASKVGDSCLSE